MAISEKEFRKLERRFEKQNERILNLYRHSEDKSLLDMLYFKTENAEELAEQFEISLEDAAELIRKEKETKQKVQEDPVGAIEEATEKLNHVGDWISNLTGKNKEQALYNSAFEFVASTGNEEPVALAEHLQISAEEAAELIQEMRNRGDIGADDEKTISDSADESSEESYGESHIFHDPMCSIQEALCFIGDIVSDTSEKICEALDEVVERVWEHDYDD